MLVPTNEQLKDWIKLHEQSFWNSLRSYHQGRIRIDAAAKDAAILTELRRELDSRGG
jgi:hypothetical protein